MQDLPKRSDPNRDELPKIHELSTDVKHPTTLRERPGNFQRLETALVRLDVDARKELDRLPQSCRNRSTSQRARVWTGPRKGERISSRNRRDGEKERSVAVC